MPYLRIVRVTSFNSRPHEEVDIAPLEEMAGAEPFNSRPHEEVDPDRLTAIRTSFSFNSRPHEEVDGSSPFAICEHLSFNSRPHEEVDGTPQDLFRNLYIFQFTTSRGGRRVFLKRSNHSRIFQFTTSRGGRLCRALRASCSDSAFNSRPHEEVDPNRAGYRSP